MKGSFLIKAKQENVITEKGVRAFILERLLNSPFERGTALNVDEKTVEVRIEGNEKQIEKFKAELEKALIAQFGNPIILFSELKEDQKLEIPALMRSSQALVVGQLQKGIGVQLAILDALKNMSAELSSQLKGMQTSLSSDLKGMQKGLSSDIRNMQKGLSDDLKALREK